MGIAAVEYPWVVQAAAVTALVLLALNLLLVAVVHGRRLRQWFRGAPERRFRREFGALLDALDAGAVARLPSALARLDELERPIAAELLLERVQALPAEERHRLAGALRDLGALELVVASTRRRIPWRRSLAIRTLGWLGSEDEVPLVIDRLDDPSRHVRESAVRAVGRLGDARALTPLAERFREPGGVAPGLVYDALIGLGPVAAPVFEGALRSPVASVRVASCFGVAALVPAEVALQELEPLLLDPVGPVRAAAADGLGLVGGRRLPEGLARATRDELPAVRRAAVRALGAFDDPHAVELAANALLDPDRETALRAGEALVRLARLPAAGSSAARLVAARTSAEWPVDVALALAALEVA